MANPVFLYPNLIDSDAVNTALNNAAVVGGGSWAATLPVTNLATDIFSDVAQSSSAANVDTRFDVDLGQQRGCRGFAIPYHNMTLAGQYRVRGSDTPKWAGATVNTTAAGGASSVVFLAGATAVNVAAGEIFSINGVTYKATNTVAISAAGTGTVNISPVLAATATAGAAITCRSGDFTAPLYDSGQIDAFGIIYPFGSIDYTHPSWWTGQATEEQRRRERFPIIKVFGLIVARYWRFEFFDSSNADGYLRFPRLFIAGGWQPSGGLAYGFEHGFVTDTQVETALGGRRLYNVQPVIRTCRFALNNLPADEAYSNAHDIIKTAGLNKQLFFIFDPDETEQMHRQSYAATMERLTPLQYPYFDNVTANFELREVVA